MHRICYVATFTIIITLYTVCANKDLIYSVFENVYIFIYRARKKN